MVCSLPWGNRLDLGGRAACGGADRAGHDLAAERARRFAPRRGDHVCRRLRSVRPHPCSVQRPDRHHGAYRAVRLRGCLTTAERGTIDVATTIASCTNGCVEWLLSAEGRTKI